MLMDGITNMLAGRRRTKASLDTNHSHFQKSSQSRRGPKEDADSAEARRKAAAWQWYQRGRGAVCPTRSTVELGEATAHRDCSVDRPKSRFKAEAAEKISSYVSSSKSRQDRETGLFDASELSSIADRVQVLVQKLKIDGVSESPLRHPVQRDGTADIKLNEQAFDVSSTSDRSQPRIAQSHQRPTEKENAFDLRSLLDLPYSRQLHQQTYEGNEIHSGAVQSKPITEKGRLQGNADITTRRKSSSFRSPLSVVRKLSQRTSRWNGSLCSEVNSQEPIHLHCYHHHYIYHHRSGEELQSPEINAKLVRLEEFQKALLCAQREDHRSVKADGRHSLDVGATYRLDCSGDDARDDWDYLYRPIEGEILVQARVHSSM